MILEITQEDIDKGEQESSKNCAAAECAKRQGAAEVEVDFDTILIDGVEYECPYELREFIRIFDTDKSLALPRKIDLGEPIPMTGKAFWAILEANFKAGKIKWVRTTSEMYHDMLNILPPTRHVNMGFLLGEPYSDKDGKPVYAAFICRTGDYEACYLTEDEFRNMVG